MSETEYVEVELTEHAAGSALRHDDEETLERLAALPPMLYERERDKAAKELGVRVPVLDLEVDKRRPKDTSEDDVSGSSVLFDEYEPWPEVVDGAALLDRLSATVSRYAIMPKGAAEAVALWVLFAHTHDCHTMSPILAILAPDSECGKTTLLNLTSWLVPRALPSSGASPATVYRVIEGYQPTLLTDELDSLPRETAEALRGIYNSGHLRRFAYILRMVPTSDDMEVRRFSTWAPKAIAQIGKPAATMLSRSIVVWMQRKGPGETVEKLPPDGTADLIELHRMCLRWATDHTRELAARKSRLPAGMSNRLADNWTPLLTIADAIAGEWPQKARDAALALAGMDKDDTSKGIQVLADLREIFRVREAERLTSQEICEALQEQDDKWSEYARGKPISQTQLSRLLKPYDIRPTTMRVGQARAKGYKQEWFKDAFARYLPQAPHIRAVTPCQPKQTAAFSDSQAVTSSEIVTAQNARKPAEDLDCHGVTAQKQGVGDEGVPEDPREAFEL